MYKGINKTQVSCRINEDTIKKIDMFVSGHRYWKRNTVIDGILTAVMEHFDDGSVYDMVRSPYAPKELVSRCYEIVRAQQQKGGQGDE